MLFTHLHDGLKGGRRPHQAIHISSRQKLMPASIRQGWQMRELIACWFGLVIIAPSGAIGCDCRSCGQCLVTA
jgi:hypothetical protein